MNTPHESSPEYKAESGPKREKQEKIFCYQTQQADTKIVISLFRRMAAQKRRNRATVRTRVVRACRLPDRGAT
ncbi:MAG: hypothetical protein P8Y78_11845 [Acidihalobacter sp.]